MSWTDTKYLQYTFLTKSLHAEFINNSQFETKEIIQFIYLFLIIQFKIDRQFDYFNKKEI